MEHLKGFPTVGDLEVALANLPQGRDALGEAYDQAIDRIMSQSEACCQMAFKVLSWLAYCQRALSVEEVQHALGTRLGGSDLDRRFLPDVDVIDSVCAGLVVYDQHTELIRLVHYTAKEYLLAHHSLSTAEEDIARTCIAYLSFDALRDAPPSHPHDVEYQQELYPLYGYAAEFWAVHASAPLEESDDFVAAIIGFLDNESIVRSAAKTMNLRPLTSNDGETNWLHTIAEDWTKVHLAAHCGFTRVITEYARQGLDLDTRDSKSRTPLIYAAASGQVGTTRVLLETGRVNPGAEEDRGFPSMLLEKGVNPNIRDNRGETALFRAADGGHEELISLLLQHRADLFITNEAFENALFPAVMKGHLPVINLLLAAGLNVDSQDITGNTPLFFAALGGSEAVITLLLDHGARVDHRNALQETVLFFAARGGHPAAVKLLLRAGASRDQTNLISETPLIYATSGLRRDIAYWPTGENAESYSTILTLFLENGDDPDPVYNEGFIQADELESWKVLLFSSIFSLRYYSPEDGPDYRRPCCKAARLIWGSRVHEYTDEQIILFLDRLIYKAQTKLTRRWRVGKATPVIWALKARHINLVMEFLKAAVRRKTKLQNTETLLEETVRYGTASLVELLLDKLVDLPIAESQFQSLVLRAINRESAAMLETLCSRHILDRKVKKSALLHAIPVGNLEAAKFIVRGATNPGCSDTASRGGYSGGVTELAALDIDFDAKDDRGRTLLFYAVQRRQLSIAQFLLQHGASPDITESDWERPLLYDAGSPFEDCDYLSPSEMRRIGGQTPLFFAAGDGNDSMTRLLLDHGANPDYQREFGERPILWAAAQGYANVVEMLIGEGANVNNCTGDDSKLAPLYWALAEGHLLPAKEIKRGCGYGRWLWDEPDTPSDMEAVVELLLRHGADPTISDRLGRGPLHWLAFFRHDSESLVEMLVEAGSDPNKKDALGRTALMHAAVRGMDSIVAALLETPGVDALATDASGRTALMDATIAHEPRIVELLSQVAAEEDNVIDSPLYSLRETPDNENTYYGAFCEMCGSWSFSGHHCPECIDGKFYVCEQCKIRGETCFNDTHELKWLPPMPQSHTAPSDDVQEDNNILISESTASILLTDK